MSYNYSSEFKLAAVTVKNLAAKPDSSELLKLYGLYKKVTVGDINIEKPNMINITAVEKWKAWNDCKLCQKDAEIEYINFVNILIDKYEVNM
jgi:acyl-CoA-binding protein